MPPKDPLMYSLLTYGWVIALSSWGGVVSYVQKVKSGATKRFSLTEFVGELCTSGFVGVMTFYLCESAGITGISSAVLIGISGHMGSRAIFLIERFLQKKFLKGLDVNPNQKAD
jgi:hypothetical protein